MAVEEPAKLAGQRAHRRLRVRLGGEVALGLLDHGVAELAETVDLDPDRVTDLQQALGERLAQRADPGRVPVAITSPGSSVNASERCATCWKQL